MDKDRAAQIVALGKDPINAASPAGEPVRYDALFERLQREMDKIGSLTGEQPNWREVTELSTDILKTKSKDLLVMTYLVVALFETEGYAGLTAGIDAYKELLNTYWEPCFPKVRPPQGRYNAVQYMVEKVHPQVENKGGQIKRAPRPAEKEAVHGAADSIKAFDEVVTAKFTTQPETPNMLPFVRAMKELKEKVGPLGPPPGAAAPPGSEAQQTGEGASGGVSAIPSTAPEQFSTATQAVQQVVKVSKYLFAQDNKDARAYRLMRAVHFGALRDAVADKTIPGPPATRREGLDKLAASGNWPQLLVEAEGQFATTPLWLDMQRLIALALNAQGPAFKTAWDAVVFETVALQRRLPELFERSFKDGRPFADGATKSWLEESGAQLGAGGGAGRRGAADAVDAGVAEARKLMGEAKGPEAVARLAALIDASAGKRDRFRAKLALASLCLDLSKLPLAASVLEGLERDVEFFQLDEWEPALAATAFRDLYTCLTRLKSKPSPDDLRRQAEVFARLSRLDAPAAFKLDVKAAPPTAPTPAAAPA